MENVSTLYQRSDRKKTSVAAHGDAPGENSSNWLPATYRPIAHPPVQGLRRATTWHSPCMGRRRNHSVFRQGKLMRRSDLLPKVIGLGTWGLITFPLWGALVAPFTLAWLVLLFNAYWLVRSSMLGVGSVVSFIRLRRSERD